MRKNYRKHDDDFKKDSIALANSSDKSIKSIANDLGINANTLRYWIKNEEKIKETKNNIVETAEEKRLRKELEDVKLERDILKKAVSIFSKQPK